MHNSPPAASDGSCGIAVSAMEKGSMGKFLPGVSRSQDSIIGDHGGVVATAATPARVTQGGVELVPLLHAEGLREAGVCFAIQNPSKLQVFFPLILEVGPVRRKKKKSIVN